MLQLPLPSLGVQTIAACTTAVTWHIFPRLILLNLTPFLIWRP